MTHLRKILPGFARQQPAAATPSPVTAEPRIKPLFQIREDEHGYDATIQLPGVAKEGLEITAQDAQLSIIGQRAWVPPADWTSLYRETTRANFELILTHEGDVDTDKISAELKDGILLLHLPKAEAAKPRKITIN